MSHTQVRNSSQGENFSQTTSLDIASSEFIYIEIDN